MFLIPLLVNGQVAQNVAEMYVTSYYSDIGTYNDMKRQTGFCKMTGFDTVSRNTSAGPPLFTSGRVSFGVGLSKYQFGSMTVPSLFNKTEGSMTCGMCINITHINNLPILNDELTSYDDVNSTGWHIAMIFDQCNDPICTSGFLDLDVYADTIFRKSFTRNIVWNAIDCPVYEDEKPEFLLCTSNTCNRQNTLYKTANTFEMLFDRTFFYIVARNLKRPLFNLSIFVQGNWVELPYIPGAGYLWNDFENPFNENNLTIMMTDVFGVDRYENFLMKDLLNKKPLASYTGGILF